MGKELRCRGRIQAEAREIQGSSKDSRSASTTRTSIGRHIKSKVKVEEMACLPRFLTRIKGRIMKREHTSIILRPSIRIKRNHCKLSRLWII